MPDSSITTDTVTLRRVIGECHLTCNKEAEIAVLSNEVKGMKETVNKLDEKMDAVSEYITKSSAEKNTIMAVIGAISGAVGMWFGSK